ncbi:MAG: hypothetical protein ACRD5M_06365 [Candidatus Acidiferrales bacterium]
MIINREEPVQYESKLHDSGCEPKGLGSYDVQVTSRRLSIKKTIRVRAFCTCQALNRAVDIFTDDLMNEVTKIVLNKPRAK